MTPPAKKDTNKNWQKPVPFPLPRDKWGHPNPPPEQAKIPAIMNPRSNTLIITRRVQHSASYNDDRNANAKGAGGGGGGGTPNETELTLQSNNKQKNTTENTWNKIPENE
jgi:hypothetical protein